MKIIVQPQKGGTYKLLFYDGRHVLGAGFVESDGNPAWTPPDKIPAEVGREERVPPYTLKGTDSTAPRGRCPSCQA